MPQGEGERHWNYNPRLRVMVTLTFSHPDHLFTYSSHLFGEICLAFMHFVLLQHPLQIVPCCCGPYNVQYVFS